MEAEPVAPVEVAINDFTFDRGDVSENGSPLTSGIDFFRRSDLNERRVGIGNDLAKRISAQAAKRLGKDGPPRRAYPGR